MKRRGPFIDGSLDWRSVSEGQRFVHFDYASYERFHHLAFGIHIRASIFQEAQGLTFVMQGARGMIAIHLLDCNEDIDNHVPFDKYWDTFSEAAEAVENEIIPYLKDVAKHLVAQVERF